MIPEPLINIRSYQVEDEAYADLAVLDAQGIVAYVLISKGKGGDGSIRLRVPESNAARAVEILGPHTDPLAEFSGAITDASADYACPRCGSPRSVAVPPYLWMGVGVSFAACLWLMAHEYWRSLVGFALLSGVVLSRLEANTVHWRCLNCGHAWNHDAERRRRADARRNAVD